MRLCMRTNGRMIEAIPYSNCVRGVSGCILHSFLALCFDGDRDHRYSARCFPYPVSLSNRGFDPILGSGRSSAHDWYFMAFIHGVCEQS